LKFFSLVYTVQTKTLKTWNHTLASHGPANMNITIAASYRLRPAHIYDTTMIGLREWYVLLVACCSLLCETRSRIVRVTRALDVLPYTR